MEPAAPTASAAECPAAAAQSERPGDRRRSPRRLRANAGDRAAAPAGARQLDHAAGPPGPDQVVEGAVQLDEIPCTTRTQDDPAARREILTPFTGGRGSRVPHGRHGSATACPACRRLPGRRPLIDRVLASWTLAWLAGHRHEAHRQRPSISIPVAVRRRIRRSCSIVPTGMAISPPTLSCCTSAGGTSSARR